LKLELGRFTQSPVYDNSNQSRYAKEK
jgi:hypothetical protein